MNGENGIPVINSVHRLVQAIMARLKDCDRNIAVINSQRIFHGVFTKVRKANGIIKGNIGNPMLMSIDHFNSHLSCAMVQATLYLENTFVRYATPVR